VGEGPGMGAEPLGRFLSPDPFVQSPGYSQSYNRYSYCFNNPLKYNDPSGFNAWKLNENPFQTFGSGNPGIFRIDWNANLSEQGSYSYDCWTGNYYNANGQEVSFDEVFVNYIQPNSVGSENQVSIANNNGNNNTGAGKFPGAISYGFNAYGQWQMISITTPDGEKFYTPYLSGENIQMMTMFLDGADGDHTGQGIDIAAAGLGFGAAAYWGETVNTLYELHESKNLANNMARAQAYKSVTGTVPKSMRTAISYGKTMTNVTKMVGRGLFVVGTAITVYDMVSNPTTENFILGSADLVMGVVSIGCPVVGLVYFTGRIIYDIVSEE
jgi:hypothetical protein